MTIAPPFDELGLGLPTTSPFTRKEAKEAGLTDPQLSRLVASGVLRRPVRSVYVASEVPDSLELRCAILRLVIPADAFVCDRSAAWLHVGSRVLAPNEHLSMPPLSCFRESGHHRLRNGLTASGERTIRPSDVQEIDGVQVTTPLRTALDLGRLQPHRDLRLSGMDAMLSTGAFEHDHLLLEIGRFAKQRGVVELRRLAPLADGLSQSFGESALRNRWYDAGLPRPCLQIPVQSESGEMAYLDMGLLEWRLAAEYDGAEWHSNDDDVRHDVERRDWLRTERGWLIGVFRKENTFGRQQDAESRLRRLAVEARRTLSARTFII